MKIEFTPDDFNYDIERDTGHATIVFARKANKKLANFKEQWLSELKKQGQVVFNTHGGSFWSHYFEDHSEVSHTAILIDITPIEKKCERHYPVTAGGGNDTQPSKYTCRDCGVALRWEAK